MFVSAQWMMLAWQLQWLWEDIDSQINQLKIQWILYNSNKGYDEWLKWQNRHIASFNKTLFMLLLAQRTKIFEKLDLISDISGKVVENTLKDFTNKTGLWVDPRKELKEVIKDHINHSVDLIKKNEIKRYEDLLTDIEKRENKKRDELLNLPQEERVKKDKEQLKEDIIDIYNSKPDKREIDERRRVEIERDLRTSLQREATAITINKSKANGYVFFLCNNLRDSAEDHCNYQGKVYVVKDYKSVLKDKANILKVESIIKTHKIDYLEDIIDGTIKYTYFLKNGQKRVRGVFLTTRWNCRHYFRPITLDEALEPQKALDKYNMTTGTYKPENYEALEEQRYLEREIRRLKQQRLIIMEQLRYCTNNQILKEDLKRINKQIKDYTATLEALCKKYNLPRAYNREQVESLTYDLGMEKAK